MSEQNHTTGEAGPVNSLSPNQVVAYNLLYARTMRGLTQEEAAEQLEPHLGTRWSKASFSAAERSMVGDRKRKFSADEIVAFARTFDVPVSFFFIPPIASEHGRLPVVHVPGTEYNREALSAGMMLAIAFGTEEGQRRTHERVLRELADTPEDSPWRTEAQRAIKGWSHTVAKAIVAESLASISTWQQGLTALAGFLAEVQSSTAAHLEQAIAAEDRDEQEGDA